MSSLKGYIPGIARLAGITPLALYERQRELVRAGLLDLPAGRGPGSGTRADARSLALLLLAALASDRLKDSARRTLEIAHLEPEDGGRCPFTGASTFLTALQALIARPERPKHPSRSLLGLYVSLSAPRAGLLYREHTDLVGPQLLGAESMIVFAAPGTREPALHKLAMLDIGVVDQIAQDLAAMTKASSPVEGV